MKDKIIIIVLLVLMILMSAFSKVEADQQVKDLTDQITSLKKENKQLDHEFTREKASYERRTESLKKKIDEQARVIDEQGKALKKEEITSIAEKNCLTKEKGVFNGPSGKETYYNLPMKGVIERMRRLGYDAEDYPYWEREDGARMLGPYVMIACNLKYRPYETIVPTSLGDGIVCDTGKLSKDQVDIAVNWR